MFFYCKCFSRKFVHTVSQNKDLVWTNSLFIFEEGSYVYRKLPFCYRRSDAMEIMTQEAGQLLGPSTSTAGSVVPTQYLAGTVYIYWPTPGAINQYCWVSGTYTVPGRYSAYWPTPGAINQYCWVSGTYTVPGRYSILLGIQGFTRGPNVYPALSQTRLGK
jgi:hypothetical protein